MKRQTLKKYTETAAEQTEEIRPKQKWEMEFRPRIAFFAGVLVISFATFLFYSFYLQSAVTALDSLKEEGTVKQKDESKINDFGSKKNSAQQVQSKQLQELDLGSKETKKTNISETKETKTHPKDKYHVLLQLVNADKESKFAKNFYHCIKSILTRTNLTLNFHLTVDSTSKETAESILGKIKQELRLHEAPRVSYYLAAELNKKIYEYTKTLQELFSTGPNTYYSNAIFFIPPALHKVFPTSIKRLVMLDTDLQFRTDIKNLFDLFAEMSPTNIMALAREQQPVYRHILWSYRNKNPGTPVGDPPPNGMTGFNSGVKLMNLDNMRRSKIYNSLLQSSNVTSLAAKYSFRGHLGDQDFFSLLSFEHPSLFYTLPCQWNRQLCTWWRENGYKDVFDDYFRCDAPLWIIHGNCDTPIVD